MIRFTSLVTLAFLSHSLALSDDNSDLTAKLLERIEKLEKRVEELEAIAKQSPRDAQPQVYVAPPSVYPPSVYPQPSTLPNQRYLPPYGAAPSTGVPKSWQPFNFNGQTYYLVPTTEAPRPDGAAVARYPMPNNSVGVPAPKGNRADSNPK